MIVKNITSNCISNVGVHAAVVLAIMGMAPDSANAASLIVVGYESATNTGLDEYSAAGPISVRGEGVATYFANNREYKDIADFSALADYGVNKVFSAGNSQAFFVSAIGTSIWSDELTLISENTSGFLRVNIDIGVNLASTLGGASSHSYELLTYTGSVFATPYREITVLNDFGY